MYCLKTLSQHIGNKSAFICIVIKLAVAHSIVSCRRSVSLHFTFTLYTGYILSHKADIKNLFPLLQLTPWELSHLYTKATLPLFCIRSTKRSKRVISPSLEKKFLKIWEAQNAEFSKLPM